MQANRARFAADVFVAAGGVTAIRHRVAALWKQAGTVALPEASSETMATLIASMNAARATRNSVLADAGKLCAAQAGNLTEAYARIDLGGNEPAITVLEPDASPALKQCLIDRLRKASFPKPGAGQSAKTVERVPRKDGAMHPMPPQ